MYKLVKASSTASFQDMIIEYFLNNTEAEDSEIHTWASSMKMTPDELEAHIYKLFSDVLGVFTQSYVKPDAAFDAVKLAQGIEEESKHTDSPVLAKMITKYKLSIAPNVYGQNPAQMEVADTATMIKGIDMQIRSLKSQIETLASQRELVQARIKMANTPEQKEVLKRRLESMRTKRENLSRQLEKLHDKKSRIRDSQK